jgi:hypothetical protein
MDYLILAGAFLALSLLSWVFATFMDVTFAAMDAERERGRFR